MLLNDEEIQALATSMDMIIPFSEGKLNPFGYDLTLSEEFLIPRLDYSLGKHILDPLDPDGVEYETLWSPQCVVPPNSFILGRSVEYIKMPEDVSGICLGRSSYARCGIIINTTPLEAGWRGTLTIEISNSTPMPARLHAGRGIAQVQFMKGKMPKRSYSSKLSGARYQDQLAVTPAKGL